MFIIREGFFCQAYWWLNFRGRIPAHNKSCRSLKHVTKFHRSARQKKMSNIRPFIHPSVHQWIMTKCRKGASIYDVHNFFIFFDTLPLQSAKFMYCFWRIWGIFDTPTFCADVVCGSPREWVRSAGGTSYTSHILHHLLAVKLSAALQHPSLPFPPPSLSHWFSRHRRKC